jgi:2-methylcitrate dehydratase PrpD
LLEGDAFVDQFRDEMLTDPRVLNLLERVTISHEPEFDRLGEGHRHHVRVEVELTDGTVLADERHVALGSSEDPLSEDDVVEKFDKLVRGRDRSEAAARVKELVLGITTLDDVAPLQEALGQA